MEPDGVREIVQPVAVAVVPPARQVVRGPLRVGIGVAQLESPGLVKPGGEIDRQEIQGELIGVRQVAARQPVQGERGDIPLAAATVIVPVVPVEP